MNLNSPVSYFIDLNGNQKRVDQWLAEKYPEESRSFWQKRIKLGEIQVNGEKVKPHHKLMEGDELKVNLSPIEKLQVEPEKMSLDILFEDENYAIINKPTGLVVHPGAGHTSGTLVNGLLYQFGRNLSHLDTDRPGIIHRLDADTSGLLIIAKNNQAHDYIAKQFSERTIHKVYYALIDEHLAPPNGTIEAPMKRHQHNRQKMTVSSQPGSRPALTHYEIEKRFNDPLPCDLVRIKIETGRTHQIRVHFSSIKHPVLGDDVYGDKNANQILKNHGLDRQFLHASEIEFNSPTTNKRVKYKSELPEDLQQILKKLT